MYIIDVESIVDYKWSSESENIESNSDHTRMPGNKKTRTYQEYAKLLKGRALRGTVSRDEGDPKRE